MINTYIRRQAYIDKVKPFINKDIIKVFTGQRRVGKSYMLYQLIDEIKTSYKTRNIIYINKELKEFSAIKASDDLLTYIENKKMQKGKIYLFIDEVQDIRDFEKALRSLNAEGNYDIYCTGSNANMMSGDLATYLSGRYIETRIYSLVYQEFLHFHKLKNDSGSFLKYIKFGGLPYLIHLQLEDNIVYEYIRNVYNTVVLKDIVKRYSIRNYGLLENLINFLSDNVGSLFSAKKISDYLKSQKLNYSPKVIIEYLHYLENSFLISKVKRWDVKGKRIFEIGEKYYFEDMGIRNSLTAYRTQDIGKIFENMVYHHLKFSGYRVFIGKVNNHEIDFIGEKDSGKLYVQVAYKITDETTIQREFGNLLKVRDNYRKIVLSSDEYISGNYEGVEHMHIRDFLNSPV